MEEILGFGTTGGLGILLAGLGVFFCGLHFMLHGQPWKRDREE